MRRRKQYADECREVPQAPVNKSDSSTQRRSNPVSKASGSDSSGSADERRSDKQNDKQNDKLISTNYDLTEIIEAWSGLPEAVRAGILALVRATIVKDSG